jgi:hypothetical protein
METTKNYNNGITKVIKGDITTLLYNDETVYTLDFTKDVKEMYKFINLPLVQKLLKSNVFIYDVLVEAVSERSLISEL